MIYTFGGSPTQYGFTFDTVNPIPAVTPVSYVYTFTFDSQYSFVGGGVVVPQTQYFTRSACILWDDGEPVSIDTCLISGENAGLFRELCLSFSQGLPRVVKRDLSTGQNEQLSVHECTTTLDPKRFSKKTLHAVSNTLQYSFDICEQHDDTDSISYTSCEQLFSANSLYIESCFKFSDASLNHEPFRDGFYYNPLDIPAPDYSFNADAVTHGSYHVPGISVYEFVHGVTYSFTVSNPVVNPNNQPSTLTEYRFDGISSIEDTYRLDLRGSLRSTICYNSGTAVRELVHFCTKFDDAIRPLRGKSIIIIPPIEPPVPIIPKQITIPTKNYYENSFTFSVVKGLTTLSDTIVFESFNASISVNSQIWDYELVCRDVGVLDTIFKLDELTIDFGVPGYRYVMIVEDRTTRISFDSNVVTFRGRGLTSEFSSPFVAPVNVTYGSSLTLNQLMDLQLPLGWALTLNNFDWVVPAFTYNVENMTPAATLQDICGKTGNVMIPHPNLKQIDVRPRYPVYPWDAVDAKVDFFVPDNALIDIDISDITRLDADSVYCHGTTSSGVLANVVRSGEAGNKPLNTVANELIVDANAARSLGGRLVAGARDTATITGVTFFGFNEIPYIQPTSLVKIRGQYLTTSSFNLNVSAGSDGVLSANMRLQFGESPTDVYSSLMELIPQSPVLIGTVTIVDGDALIIQTPEGGSFRAFGSGVIGQRYYFRSGQLIGDAPSLPAINVTV